MRRRKYLRENRRDQIERSNIIVKSLKEIFSELMDMGYQYITSETLNHFITDFAIDWGRLINDLSIIEDEHIIRAGVSIITKEAMTRNVISMALATMRGKVISTSDMVDDFLSAYNYFYNGVEQVPISVKDYEAYLKVIKEDIYGEFCDFLYKVITGKIKDSDKLYVL